MMGKKKFWLSDMGDKFRKAQHGQPEPEAFFGYRRIPEHEKTRWVLRHFNSVAKQYDFMNTLLSFGIHHIWKREAVNRMGLRSGDRVIDVCGGTGDLALLAARKVGTRGAVTIYDINRAMIAAGRDKIARSKMGRRITAVEGNAEELSFPDNCFDAAMVGYGIRNVTHMEKGFEEMYRVLKPRGKLMCLEFSKPTDRWFRYLYDFYSFHIMPLLGELMAGSRNAYTHLPESIRTFPMPDELSDILSRIGFNHVNFRRQTNGISVIHLGVK
ncbi:MAG: bifunctional demethylmenaquinone methyltransferase/2-methoxy-6-polyprenyl-1,4-benzoquinol methylase UbiE [Desulfobacterales bacterium]|jgi:demethylmenaquinone methyltransferase/2-methoxy-6-polyprenyl-1,4-benzoquinol methylase|nr:bifunctional demethylmenaquinone methyltransferase/2-methoxy-6-polyprenyl-1,4-benzoquinol methylase UbiE [Desulfobacterales bacterium]